VVALQVFDGALYLVYVLLAEVVFGAEVGTNARQAVCHLALDDPLDALGIDAEGVGYTDQ
jgi:hypothetical protein